VADDLGVLCVRVEDALGEDLHRAQVVDLLVIQVRRVEVEAKVPMRHRVEDPLEMPEVHDVGGEPVLHCETHAVVGGDGAQFVVEGRRDLVDRLIA